MTFAETFDCTPFIGMAKFPKLHCNGYPVVVDGKQQWGREGVSVKGGPKMEFFVGYNGLDENSNTTQEWFKAFLPDRIPSTTPGADPPRDAKDSGSAWSHSTHLETSSSDRP